MYTKSNKTSLKKPTNLLSRDSVTKHFLGIKKRIVRFLQNKVDSDRVRFTKVLSNIQTSSLKFTTRLKVYLIIFYIPKILKQGDSNTNILSENFTKRF